jgi:transposase
MPYCIASSAITAVAGHFIINQLDKLIKLYDQQIDQISQQIDKLLDKDPALKTKIEQLCQIKGLGLLSVATIVAETNGFTGFDRTGAPECRPTCELCRL